MHLSNILTSLAFVATGSTAVLPRILTDFGVENSMGTLPQIIPTADTILIDMTNLGNAVTNLTSALSNLSSNTPTGIIKSSLDTAGVLSRTIAVQSAIRQCMLDAQELDNPFSASESTAIVSKLKNEILPNAQTALKLLGEAKAQNLLTKPTTNYAVLPYLNVLSEDYDKFNTGLQKYLDSGSQADAKTVLNDIKNLLSSTIATYSSWFWAPVWLESLNLSNKNT